MEDANDDTEEEICVETDQIKIPKEISDALSEEGETILTFGKYKGLSYAEVHEQCSGYCEWARKIQDPTDSLFKFQQWLSKQ